MSVLSSLSKTPALRLLLFLLVFPALPHPLCLAGSGPLPNIVLIISDDQGYADYGFMKHPVIQTPRLDGLAREGLVYPRAYVPTSLCRPSLASIITGLFPHQHGISGNDPAGVGPIGGRNLKYQRDDEVIVSHMDSLKTLPRMLAELGYRSFQAGKWWEGSYRRGGFSEGMTRGDTQAGRRLGDAGTRIGREGMEPVFEFIDSVGGDPFLLWYAPFMPHQPHTPPGEMLEKYSSPGRSPELAAYYGMVEWFDQTVGTLLDHIRDRGKIENTLVLYVCDNGWIQRTPGTVVPSGWKQPFAPKSKGSPNEGGLRTPIIVWWPGQIHPGWNERPVSSLDLVPTILAAVGLPAPDLPGVNLLDAAAVEGRTHVFGEVFGHDVRDLEDPVRSLQYRWCVQGRWKLIVPNILDNMGEMDRQVQLYDVVADPLETNNLVFGQPETVSFMRTAMERWWPIR